MMWLMKYWKMMLITFGSGLNKGLVKFNPETKDIHVFTTKDGTAGEPV